MSTFPAQKVKPAPSKKIMFFISSREIGGVETALLNLLNAWPDKSDEFSVWCNKGYKGKDLYKRLKVRCEAISFPSFHEICDVINGSRLPYILKAAGKCIVKMSMGGIFCASVAYFVKRLKKSRFDIVFSDNGGYPAAELCLALIIASKIAGVSRRFLMINSCPAPRSRYFKFMEGAFDTLISRAATNIITISHACAGQLERLRFHGIKINVIYNGISAVRTDKRALPEKRNILGIGENEIIIGVIGDYEELKGHESLMRAFLSLAGAYPQAKLVFIGSAGYAYSKYLRNLAKSLNIQGRVVFTGYLESAWEFIECFRVLVLPSIAYEGFGMVLLEAMLYKKPMIGTNIGGVPEVIGDAGLVVEPGAPGELAGALARLLDDPRLCDELGKKGFMRLNKEFTAAMMAEKYFSLTRSEEIR
jgi:L-malate glycosyltransferase